MSAEISVCMPLPKLSINSKRGTRPPRILFHCPRSTTSSQGNSISANRIAILLRELGCVVRFSFEAGAESFDYAFAQNAIRSREWVAEIENRLPVVVLISGTELLADSEALRESLQSCIRATVTSEAILQELPLEIQQKTRVISKSVALPPRFDSAPTLQPDSQSKSRIVSVLGHARKVKRPLAAAFAARNLPASSGLKVHLIGKILEESCRQKILAEQLENSRFDWLGELERAAALAQLSRSLATVNSSIVEGGANSVAEAVMLDVPVLATRIPANLGFLGASHPAFFDIDNIQQLTELMSRLESEPEFRREIVSHQHDRKRLFDPALERQGWLDLLSELI